MKAICKRELRALMGGFRGWGYVAIVLLGAAVSVILNNLLAGSPKFEMSAMYIALSMIPATAIAAADSFQVEKRQKTERLLFSLPIRNSGIVIGKLLAHMVPVVIAAIGLCVFPLVMKLFGPVDLVSAYAVIAALLMMGIACMALGLAVSACVNGRATAFLATVILLVLSWAAPYAADYLSMMTGVTIPIMIGCMVLSFVICWQLSGSVAAGTIITVIVEIPLLLAYLDGSGASLLKNAAAVVRKLSLFDGLNAFVNGLMDGRALIMWAVVAAFMVFVMLLYIGNRRQAGRRAL